jgi:quercetin dioxygenase-like cupin family protein
VKTASILLAASMLLRAQSLPAQPAGAGVEWTLLMKRPLPDAALPNFRVLELKPRAVPRPEGARGHTHAGPVVGYVVQGNIESQVDPDPPETLKPGDAFFESPGQLHRYIRTASGSEPGTVLVFMPGYGDGEAPNLKVLVNRELTPKTGQEMRLLRLTLQPGAEVEIPANRNAAAIGLIEGSVLADIDGQGRSLTPGEFVGKSDVKTVLRNSDGATGATVLVFQVVSKQAPNLAQ